MSPIILLAAVDLGRGTFLLLVALVALAMLTDWADGRFARLWDICSERGYVLDAMGDRAVHLALTLVVLVRYGIHPVFVWLLIFRDVAIYAIRVLATDWHTRSKRIQWISRFHATNLRIWLVSYFARDGVLLFTGEDRLGFRGFEEAQYALLVFTLVLSYWGLLRAGRWLWRQGTEPQNGSTA